MALKKAKRTTADFILSITEILRLRYPDDQCAPGIVISDLGAQHLTTSRFYASACRYSVHGKTVIYKAQGSSIRAVVKKLAAHVVGTFPREQRLREIVEDLAGEVL